VARISAGRDQDGRRIRKTVYAQTQAEAQAKLIDCKRAIREGAWRSKEGGRRRPRPILPTGSRDVTEGWEPERLCAIES